MALLGEIMEKLFSKTYFRVIVAVVCTLLWGTAYPMIKLGYQAANVETIPDKVMFAACRYILAFLMLFIVLLCIKSERKELIIEKERILPVIIYGLVQTGIMYLLNYIGVANTTATKTSVLTALSAFLAVVFAPLFFKNEKWSVMKITGVIIGLSGIVIINLGFFSGSFTFLGEGLVILATILNTAGGFIGKVVAKGKVFPVTAYQLLVGGIFLLVVGLIFGGHIYFDIKIILITLYLAFVSAAAFGLWTLLLVYNEAGKVLVFNLLIPIFGAVFSFLILGEKEILSPLYIVSIVLVSIGVMLVNLNTEKKKGND